MHLTLPVPEHSSRVQATSMRINNSSRLRGDASAAMNCR